MDSERAELKYLMIGDQDNAILKLAFDSPIRQHSYLVLHSVVAGDVDDGRRPPLCHGQYKERHALLGGGHVAVVIVFLDQVERRSNVLRDSKATESSVIE